MASTEGSASQNPIQKAEHRVIRNIEISRIKVKGDRRSLDPKKVRRLAISIPKLGLRHPVTVRGGGLVPIYLVAGLHRLEAVKQLKWQTIPCEFLHGGKRVARLWEISENLDRAELTALERDRLIAEWVRLSEDDGPDTEQSAEKKKGRPKGGIAKAARELLVIHVAAARLQHLLGQTHHRNGERSHHVREHLAWTDHQQPADRAVHRS
jgi:hypothetical protein